MKQSYPRGVAHVGITVPAIEDAIDWYGSVLDFDLLMGPQEITHGEGNTGKLVADALGEFDTVKIAHMATGDGFALEFFEFPDTQETEVDPKQTGYFHICVIDPAIEDLASTIEETGGELTSDFWPIYPDQEYRTTYCRNPWDNIIEIFTHSNGLC